VRRDRADVFCTLAEGIKGQRAVDWGLVDQIVPRSKFEEAVVDRARQLAANGKNKTGSGIRLASVHPYRWVTFDIDRSARVATLTVKGPDPEQPTSLSGIQEAGAEYWPLRAFREINDALLNLRFNEPEIGVLKIKTQGDLDSVRRIDETLARFSNDWLVNEILLFMKRTLKRLDVTSRTIFALIEPGSCFAGSLLELALAADRAYMLDSPDEKVQIALTPLNQKFFPMANGLTRIESRFLGDPQHAKEVLSRGGVFDALEAEGAGLVTFAIDDIDYEDDVRVAIEERASLSPDALTGMEANLRFAGPETMETKIFGRLSAWQNWIFTRPNAVGEKGALSLYGKPERPSFDWKRT
jgi:benzoyl-CoA-dihydrodiol lyase